MAVTTIGNNPKSAIEAARREVAEEELRKGVEQLKTKLRERARAQTVLDNIDREIQEIEIKIAQGNV